MADIEKQAALVAELPQPTFPPSQQLEAEATTTNPRCTYNDQNEKNLREDEDSSSQTAGSSSERIAESDNKVHRLVDQEKDEASSTIPPPPERLGIPDGGTTAWLVVLGAWCVSFCSYGWINSELFPSQRLGNNVYEGANMG